MKHKQDIYKKPTISVTEIMIKLLISMLLGVFIFFEITVYLHKIPQLDAIIPSIDFATEIATNDTIEVSAGEASNDEASVEEEASKEAAAVPSQASAIVSKDTNTSAQSANTGTSDKEKTLLKMMMDNDDPHQKFGDTSLMEKILSETDASTLQQMVLSYAHFSVQDKDAILRREIDLNHIKTVSKLLDRNFALITPYTNANQLIFERKYTMAMLLLKRGVIDPKSMNEYGYTLLHEAAAKGHATLIRLLVSLGADVNATANDGASALHYPAHLGFTIACSTLISLGIDVNKKATLKYPGVNWKGYTPLHVAASRGKYEIVELLLKANAKVDELDNEGLTAYEIASEKQYTKVMALLKPYMNSDSNTTHPQESSQSSTLEDAVSSDS